jgi:hypothetical protein
MPNRTSGMAIRWEQDTIAGVPLRRHVAHCRAIVVGAVEYDGSNRLWTWSSPLVEDAWGHAMTEAGAKQGFEAWLREWAENFRPLLEE